MIEQPFQLGPLRVANRLVVAPMTTYSSLPSGEIAPDELPYLERRARGGFGIVMTAACCVHPTGWAFHGQWQCSDDRFLPSLRSVADAIHRGGSAAILQIHHGGRQCPPDLCGGEPLSASAIPAREGAPVPRAMTETEIHEVIAAFGAAARRAETAGFDGVEIHGANTYLLQQFVSPHSNRRTDAWGEDPLRFSLAVTEAVQAAVSPNFAVGYRFSPEESGEPGLTIERTEALVDRLLERNLSFLHISLRDFRQPSIRGDFEEPTLARIARRIGGRVPLIGVGSVKTREDAEAAMTLGSDLVAVGRSAISDPEWPQHAAAGEPSPTKIPRTAAATRLTLPRPLAEKIENTPGWFELED